MLVSLERVGHTYRSGLGPGAVEVRALHDITLTIAAGEFVAIVGQSGSGKTTLLDVLGCLRRPTEGDYRLDGRSVGALSDRELATLRNTRLGFVFQSFHLLPRKTALDNVMLPLQYAGVAASERLRRAQDMLNRVGLGDRLHHRPNQLSGGQQQRVAIARALVGRPSLLLADEPTGSLDSRSGDDILAMLASLHREGQTIVLVTHAREVAERADRIVTIRDGQVLSDVAAVPAGAGAATP